MNCRKAIKKEMTPTNSDKLAASVFALGLTHGFVRREDVVRWADRRILEIDHAPEWLIDLSLSRDRHFMDLIGDLKRLADGVDPVTTCEAVYALLPDVSSYTFDEAETFAGRLYRITYQCLNGDRSKKFLSATDSLADHFEFLREGDLATTEQAVIGAVRQFVEDHRNDSIVRLLHPVRWSAQTGEGPKAGAKGDGPFIHLGVASWIIQDGNYGDLAVGQEYKFALEFYPANGLSLVQEGPTLAEHLKAARYNVRGRVVFADTNVWVIDAGSFLAYRGEPPPPNIVVGKWVEGEAYLGIDPFFYFEDLHRMEGMPPLTCSWRVRRIMRETTPWIEAKDAQGRPYRTRDESRESFVPARETRAWDEDGGNAHYVLECERLSGPELPGVP